MKAVVRISQADATKHAGRVAKRYNLREGLMALEASSKQDGTPLFHRHEDEDPYDSGTYSMYDLLQPPYDFSSLYTIYEESDILQECVSAMQENVDGFGFDFAFLGDDFTQKDTPAAQTELKRLEDFFGSVNEKQSFTTVRKLLREDYEVLGNAALEVVRNNAGKVQMVYHVPMRYLRLSRRETNPINMDVVVSRNGKDVKLTLRKRFRKVAQKSSGGKTLRWFKEFGDTRTMDAMDGKYKGRGSCKMVASEILWIKNPLGGAVYGLPRWIGSVLDAMGRRSAQYVNYDLFDSQGIPPMCILVSNGTLTDDSITELEKLVRGMRGVEQWNRIVLLESQPESLGLEDKGGAKIELKNLAEYRREDQMFNLYLKGTAHSIRHNFRLPPLYTGETETFTLATSKAAKIIAEEQVFIPERAGFDEIVNSQIMPELGASLWSFRSKGPRMVGAEEISKGVETFTKVGAFTVNQAIGMANNAFGLTMSKYKEKWADYPLPLILKLLEQGVQVTGLDQVTEQPAQMQFGGGRQPLLPAPPTKALVPYFPQKILKSDLFSEEEKKIYKQLLLIQSAVENLPMEEDEPGTEL